MNIIIPNQSRHSLNEDVITEGCIPENAHNIALTQKKRAKTLNKVISLSYVVHCGFLKPKNGSTDEILIYIYVCIYIYMR